MRVILSFLICAVLLTACKSPKLEEPTPPAPQESEVVIPPFAVSQDYLGPICPMDGMVDWQQTNLYLPSLYDGWDIFGGINDILTLAGGIMGFVTEAVALDRARRARVRAANAVRTLKEVTDKTKAIDKKVGKYKDTLVYISRSTLDTIRNVTEKTRLEQQLQRQQLQVSMLNQELALTSSMRNDSLGAILCDSLSKMFQFYVDPRSSRITSEDVRRYDSIKLSEWYPILHEWIGPDNKRYKDLIAYIDWVLHTEEPVRQLNIIQVDDNIALDMNAWNRDAELQKGFNHLYRSALVNNYALVVLTYLLACDMLDKPTRHTYANAKDIRQHLDTALKQYNRLLLSYPVKRPQQTVCNIYGCHFTADTVIYTIPYPQVTYKKDYLSAPDSIVFGFDQNVSLEQQRACQLSPKEVHTLYQYYYPKKNAGVPIVDSILVAKAGMTKQQGSGQPWLLLNGPVAAKNKEVTCTAAYQGKDKEENYQAVSMGTLTWQNNKYTGWKTGVCWYRLNIVKH